MVIDLSAMEERIAQRVAQLLEQSIGDDVLTTEQTAAFLHIHENTVLALTTNGGLPGRKVGRDWRFRRSALLAHVTPSTPATLPQAADKESL